MISAPDEQLMRDAREGDLRGIGVLFERHHARLFNYFLRLTCARSAAEDLVQEVFFRIMRSRQTYKDGTPFTVWLYAIARNARIDQVRKGRREVALENEELRADSAPRPDAAVAANEETELLKRAMAALPEDKRELLVLTRYENLKYEQVARLLGCEVGTVKVRIHRAVRELREAYEKLARSRVA